MGKNLLDIAKRGQKALGVYIGNTGLTVTEIAAWTGFDYMRIDYEHSMANLAEVGQMIRIADAADTPTLVRVSCMDDITKLLDFGASGIMVPGVESQEMAQEVVNRCKFAPVGKRGMDDHARCVRYGYQSYKEYLAEANDKVAVCVQIESREGMDNLDDILSVEGIDLVTVGKLDLSQSLGVLGQAGHASVLDGEEYIIQKALEHGKIPLITASSPQKLTSWNYGGLLATVAFDIQLITDGFRNKLKEFRQG